MLTAKPYVGLQTKRKVNLVRSCTVMFHEECTYTYVIDFDTDKPARPDAMAHALQLRTNRLYHRLGKESL